MSFLYFLESIRNPVFDFIFSLITHIGEETVFLVVAIFFFWCVSKREGYYVMIVGFVGTVVNQILKLAFRISRPWVIDPDFSAVESAIPEATGYSFPSGHTQNVTGTFGSIARSSTRKGVRIFGIVIIVLVAFSRMYLGVHTPLDVCTSLLIGAALTFALYPVFKSEERFSKFMPLVVLGSCLLSIVFLLYVLLTPDNIHEAENLASGIKNAFTLLGCTAGLVVVYTVDSKWIKFDTDAPWYAQIIKLAVGLACVLGIKAGLSAPLTALFGNEYIARAVRYFIVVLFAGCLWPLSFPYFAKMRISCLDAFGEKVKNLFAKKRTGCGEEKNL